MASIICHLELLNEQRVLPRTPTKREWEWPRKANGEFTSWERGRATGRESILTAVNQPVVVLLERLGTVPATLEMYRGDTLRATLAVVVKGDILEGADCGVEELLKTHE